MIGTRFDAWTRRRFGLAAGGVLAALTPIVELDSAAGTTNKVGTKPNKKRRKRRCRGVRQQCRPKKKTRRCCAGLRCDETIALNGLARRCCRQPREACADVADCCYPADCGEVVGLTGQRCCREHQRECASDAECCSDLRCRQATGLDGRRCCAEVGSLCHAHGDCCAPAFCNPVTLICEYVS